MPLRLVLPLAGVGVSGLRNAVTLPLTRRKLRIERFNNGRIKRVLAEATGGS